MIGRIISMILTLAVAVILITLFVINRHDVTLVLDPFNPQSPAFALTLPFDDPALVMKAELMKIPLYGWFSRKYSA